MDLRIVGAVAPERAEALATVLGGQHTLEDVVRWAIAEGHDIDPIAMDEFTHDVRVPLAADLVLVYDTT